MQAHFPDSNRGVFFNASLVCLAQILFAELSLPSRELGPDM